MSTWDWTSRPGERRKWDYHERCVLLQHQEADRMIDRLSEELPNARFTHASFQCAIGIYLDGQTPHIIPITVNADNPKRMHSANDRQVNRIIERIETHDQ